MSRKSRERWRKAKERRIEKQEAREPQVIICPYCNTQADMVFGNVIYPRMTRLHRDRFYKCPKCVEVYVGCHKGTAIPLGRLADGKLRAAKMRAHDAFDPLWKEKMRRGEAKKVARTKGYQWLAQQLDIDAKDCHIGMFDVATCDRVVTICRPYHGACR